MFYSLVERSLKMLSCS